MVIETGEEPCKGMVCYISYVTPRWIANAALGGYLSFAIRLYRFVRYVFRFAAYVQLISQPAYRLAQNPAEKATVMRFALRLTLFRTASVVSRLLQRIVAREDTSLTLQGIKYSVGINSHETTVFGEIYHDRGYERAEDFVPKAGWVVVDIGANVGIFAVQQALRGVRVYAFEPNPDCYRRLRWTVEANKLSDSITAYNLAIGATQGVGTMMVERGFTLGGMIQLLDVANSSDRITISITSLDDVVPTLNVARIDLMKIDTEGAEVAALRGAERTLEIVDRLIMEYHSHDLREQVKALLHERGFMLVRQDDHDPVVGRGILYARRSTTA